MMTATAGARYRSGAVPMEWRKLRTIRSTWLILALFAAGVLGYATLVGAGGPTQPDPGYDPTDNVLQGLLIGQLTLGILGALTLSGEFGSGSIRPPSPPPKVLFPVDHGQHWVVKTWSGALITALLGAVCVLAGVWLARAVILFDAWLIRSLLGPSRVSELERTRAIAVEDAASALRRVERDLHDGAQVRLAAVTLSLGMALEKTGDDALSELLSAAQTEVGGALTDLRRIARGIHPPVLDSGLADALASVAAACPIPVRISADLPDRPSPAIETMAYFCITELLANAIKHSSANIIEITIDSERMHALRVRVEDDGVGGAAAHRGSGLEGLAQRVSTVDGTLRVVSPPGGPTLVTIELPMRVRGGGN